MRHVLDRGTLSCLENQYPISFISPLPDTRLSGPSSSSQLRDPPSSDPECHDVAHVHPARANQPLHHAELLTVLNANIDSLEVGKASSAPLLGSVGPPGLFLGVVGFSGPLRVARGLLAMTAETHHVATWRTRHEAPVAEAISSCSAYQNLPV